jgi:hypothetical protein
VLTLAVREAATRSALRAAAPARADASTAQREARAWQVLDARATELYARLVGRHPVVARTVMLEAHATQAALTLLLAAFVVGLALSVADSRVRIEIVAFPLLGLVLWNLVVYAVLAWTALRKARPRAPTAAATKAGWVAWPLRWGWRRAAQLVRQASFYHRPLATALRRYSDDWWPFAQPLLALQGKRLFHLGAAVVALGLVAGFYVRGLALEYRAGWESTFLTATQVRALLHVLYGPASAVTGIALPADDVAIEALHWRNGAGGGPAAPWIHLMAATALLFVVVPRLVLACVASLSLAGASRRLVAPDALLPYARAVLGGSDLALPALELHALAYAYRPDDRSLAGLEALARAAFGPATRLELGAPIAYGDEQAAAGRLAGAHDLRLLLFSLAATPEAENHGAVLEAAAQASSRTLALVDEAPYLAAMGADATLASRIAERREAWRTFVRRHGREAIAVDLASLADGSTVTEAPLAQLRAAARGAGA